MKIRTILAVVALCATGAYAQAPGGRDTFVLQQAYAEMQRISGQVDVLQNNIDDLARRIAKLERASASDDSAATASRIASLEATVASLRRDIEKQRGEIVKDLSSRIAKIPQAQPQPAPSKAPAVVHDGPHREYVVASGDTLWLIAKAFNTTVPKIREMNNLKNDSLRVGQKIMLPAEQEGGK